MALMGLNIVDVHEILYFGLAYKSDPDQYYCRSWVDTWHLILFYRPIRFNVESTTGESLEAALGRFRYCNLSIITDKYSCYGTTPRYDKINLCTANRQREEDGREFNASTNHRFF